MQIGMIGMGRMGANMARRLMRGGHECVVHDVSKDAMDALAREGAARAASLDDFVARLAKPRIVWLMVRKRFTPPRPAGEPPPASAPT